MRDPYSLLGVKRNADVSEIKAAWRTKAKSVHPDHNQDDPGAGERFAEVGQAYELLKDPVRRKRYDRAADKHQTIMEQRETARQQAERAKAAQASAEKIMEELARANARRAQANAAASAGAGSGMRDEAASVAGAAASGVGEDIIERIFGSGADSQAKTEEQAKASQASQTSQASQASQASRGAQTAEPAAASSGAAAGAGAGAGATAGASGASSPDATEGFDAKPLPVLAVDLIASLVRRIRGTTVAPEKAPDLSVDATVTITDLLQQTTVTVQLAEEREVRVPLERGMTEGQVVRLKGQGLKVPNMKPGDLLVNLKLARDAQYRLNGYDIHTALSVSLEDAVLGTEVTLETPDGSRQVDIPAWSGSDQTIRLEGLGLHTDAETRGDLIVELRILLWEKPDQKVTDLMRHMRHGLYL
jgi:DnaJ-class molecular chaperone